MAKEKERILIEIDAAEGGDDAKLLAQDMAGYYGNAARRHCL